MSKILGLMNHGRYDIETGRLNTEGRQQVRSTASRYSFLLQLPDVVLHSPLPRTTETAGLFARALFVPAKIEFASRLVTSNRLSTYDKELGTSYGNIPQLLAELDRDFPTAKTIVMISHQPEMRDALKPLLGVEKYDKEIMRGQMLVFEAPDIDAWRDFGRPEMRARRNHWNIYPEVARQHAHA